MRWLPELAGCKRAGTELKWSWSVKGAEANASGEAGSFGADRVLTVIAEQAFARVPGGTGRYTREVVAALGSAVPSGWSARSVTAWHGDPSPVRVAGVRGPHRLPVEARILARLWERGLGPSVGGTVVHALTPLAPARLRRGQVLVMTVHDAIPFTHPETLTPHGAAWHRLMIGRGSELAAAVVVPTHAVAADLLAAGIGRRVEVIGEGTAPALSAAVSLAEISRLTQSLGLPGRYLLTVGTLEPRKGLDILLDAIALAPGRDVELAVVGQPGWGGSDIAAQAAARGITDRVHVLGRLSDADLATVMAGACASVTPSRSEGFGLPLLEAMSRGIPVIHSDAAALVEVAGEAGLAVPVGDSIALSAAIDLVLGDPALAARMSTAGRLRAADFSWDTVASQLWDLYQDVVRTT